MTQKVQVMNAHNGGDDEKRDARRRRTHLDCESGIGVEFKSVLRLGLKNPLPGVNVHVLTSVHHLRHRSSTPSSVRSELKQTATRLPGL